MNKTHRASFTILFSFFLNSTDAITKIANPYVQDLKYVKRKKTNVEVFS